EFYESEEQYARAYSAWEDDQRAARRAAEAQQVGRMRRCMSLAKFSDDSQFFSVLTEKEFHQKDFNLETILKLHKRVLNATNPEEAGKLRKRAHRKARYELDLEYYQCMRTGVLDPFIGKIIFLTSCADEVGCSSMSGT
uniref:PHM7_cyt domain-containing protein n=1 Tax=Globodera pallida TaxID=36090 RepID=A0A183CSX4_GLOPA